MVVVSDDGGVAHMPSYLKPRSLDLVERALIAAPVVEASRPVIDIAPNSTRRDGGIWHSNLSMPDPSAAVPARRLRGRYELLLSSFVSWASMIQAKAK